MIWWVCLFLAILIALYLVQPLLPAKTREAKMRVSLFMVLFVGAALGIYKQIGAPEMSVKANHQQTRPAAQIEDQPDINAMVQGLADRLAQEPNDPEGWTRLIRSRIVLGDIKGAIRDHKMMRTVFATDLITIAEVSENSGFNALANEALKTQNP